MFLFNLDLCFLVTFWNVFCTFTDVENSKGKQTVMLLRTLQEQESPAAVICRCYRGYSSQQKFSL